MTDDTRIANILDDIHVDNNGRCNWADVANAQALIRAAIHRLSEKCADYARIIVKTKPGTNRIMDEPVAWRWRHGNGPWKYSEIQPGGDSIHLFEVEALYHDAAAFVGTARIEHQP